MTTRSTHATAPLAAYGRRQSLEDSVWYGGWLLTFLATGQDTGGRFALIDGITRKGNVPPALCDSLRKDQRAVRVTSTAGRLRMPVQILRSAAIPVGLLAILSLNACTAPPAGNAARSETEPPAPAAIQTMKTMKTIGVLGGLGPQATMDFEQRVHRGTTGYPAAGERRVSADGGVVLPPPAGAGGGRPSAAASPGRPAAARGGGPARAGGRLPRHPLEHPPRRPARDRAHRRPPGRKHGRGNDRRGSPAGVEARRRGRPGPPHLLHRAARPTRRCLRDPRRTGSRGPGRGDLPRDGGPRGRGRQGGGVGRREAAAAPAGWTASSWAAPKSRCWSGRPPTKTRTC